MSLVLKFKSFAAARLRPTLGEMYLVRGRVVDEKTFWICLEYRLCGEFAGLSDRRYRSFWCDGFEPINFLLDGASPRIIGRCWICKGNRQSKWKFSLLLPEPCDSRDNINWKSLLPAVNMTRWMSFDEDRQYIEIEPAVAIPDLA